MIRNIAFILLVLMAAAAEFAEQDSSAECKSSRRDLIYRFAVVPAGTISGMVAWHTDAEGVPVSMASFTPAYPEMKIGA